MKIRSLLAIVAILSALPALAVAPKTLYVAKTGSDSSATPTDPNTPLLTIGEALNQTAPNDQIRIGAGTYLESGLEITMSVGMMGEGPEQTIIQGAASPGTASNRIFSIPTGNLVSIDGLTIENGVAPVGGTGDGNGGGIFNAGSHVFLNNVNVRNNRSANHGGGIYHTAGYFSMTNSTVIGNIAGLGGNGGGLYMLAGSGRIEGSRYESNHAGNGDGSTAGGNGGGVFFGAEVGSVPIEEASLTDDDTAKGEPVVAGGGSYGDYFRVQYVTFAWNRAGDGDTGAGGNGGAIANYGAVHVKSSLFDANGAGHGGSGANADGGNGGGLINHGALKLKNVTMVANFAGDGGATSGFGGSGGAFDSTTATGLLEVNWSTVTNNLAGSGFQFDGYGGGAHSNTGMTKITAKNSIFYDNMVGATGGGPDLAGDGIESLGHNVIGDSGFFMIGNTSLGDILGMDPNLGALSDNGGPTLSRLPLLGSLVNGQVPVASWLRHDQRGYKRPDLTSIGAADRDATPPSETIPRVRFGLPMIASGADTFRLRLSTTVADSTYQVFRGDDIDQLVTPEGSSDGRVAVTSRTPGTGGPMLFDIPILGHLFKNESERKDKNFLIIFITPMLIPET